MLLDRQVRVALEEEEVVEDVVGAGERRLDVAELAATTFLWMLPSSP